MSLDQRCLEVPSPSVPTVPVKADMPYMLGISSPPDSSHSQCLLTYLSSLKKDASSIASPSDFLVYVLAVITFPSHPSWHYWAVKVRVTTGDSATGKDSLVTGKWEKDIEEMGEGEVKKSI